MVQRSLPARVEILEKRMTSLDGLPERVDSLAMQIAQFREEVRGEFSAIRTELSAMAPREEVRALAATLRGEIQGSAAMLREEIQGWAASLRAEMREGDGTLRDEMRACEERLRTEIRDGDEETRRYMRVLHEELVARIAVLGEVRRPGRKRR